MLDFGQGRSVPVTEMTTVEFLRRRRAELVAQISAIKGQLAPKEKELTQIEQMIALTEKDRDMLAELAAAISPRSPLSQMVPDVLAAPQSSHVLACMDGLSQLELAQGQATKYEAMTIKEVAIQALVDHFPKGGTMMEIRDFIRLGYGRVIEPSSLRPQMHRLKADGILGHDPSTDTWDFRDGKRLQYAMFDHPTSRAGMKELKDDEISPDEPKTRLREMGEPNTLPKSRGKII
jgi:hypothetical protein